MEVVIKTGGKQFFVQEGDKIQAELTGNEVGSEVELNEVLLLSDNDSVISDPKALKAVKVKAKVVANTKGKKLKVCKFRRRQDSKTLNGHRQKYQTLEITSISK